MGTNARRFISIFPLTSDQESQTRRHKNAHQVFYLNPKLRSCKLCQYRPKLQHSRYPLFLSRYYSCIAHPFILYTENKRSVPQETQIGSVLLWLRFLLFSRVYGFSCHSVIFKIHLLWCRQQNGPVQSHAAVGCHSCSILPRSRTVS